MIVIPRGWTLVNELDHLVLVHAGGRDVAVIRYRERCYPLHKVGALVRAELAAHPQFTPAAVPDVVERVLTSEGEYGALATIEGEERGAPAQRDLGYVFGDDFYAVASAVCYRPDQFEEVTKLVREIVVTDTHALGVRRRRYEYSPPRGWQPIVRYFVTDWLAPEYPKDPVHVTVYPANPRAIAPPNLLAALAASGRGPDSRVEREQIMSLRTPSGLAGEVADVAFTTGARRTVKQCLVLADQRYTYSMEVTAQSDAQLAIHRHEIEELFTSVQPIPAPRDEARDMDLAVHSYLVE